MNHQTRESAKRIARTLTLAAVAAAMSAAAQVPPAEREVLIDLFDSTGGLQWHNQDGWLGEVGTECDWYGINCRQGSAVTSVSLATNNLTGTLPDSIFELERLKVLNLSGNNIGGAIPGPNDPLDLSPDLRIHLGGNRLDGPIPPPWSDAVIDTFELAGNPLNQNATDILSSAPSARRLVLSGTQLHGSLPGSNPGIDDDLLELDLSSNSLSGTLPAWLADLDLARLELAENRFEGGIHPAVEALVTDQYVHLDLSDNLFSGAIPEQLSELRFVPANDTGVPAAGLPGQRKQDLPGLDLCWNALDAPDETLAEFIEQHHFGESYFACDQSRQLIRPAISGSWYTNTRSGEGIVQHILDNGRALLFWFTYPDRDDEQQAWYFRVTNPSEMAISYNGLHRTDGRFGEGGTAHLKDFRVDVASLDNNRQQLAYSRASLEFFALGTILFETMSQTHEQTPLTRLAGTSCDDQQPHQWISGAWYDPARSGEGFIVDVNQDGRVVVYWFTYEPNDSGHQAWMIGTGEFNNGQVVIDEMIQPVGTQFGTNFVATEVEHIDWGLLTLEFDSEDSGHIWFESNLEDYGSGEYDIERLARPMLAECDDQSR